MQPDISMLQRVQHTWSILRNYHSSMIEPDIRSGRRALVGYGVLLLHLQGDTGRAVPVSLGARKAVWSAGRALNRCRCTRGLPRFRGLG